MGAHHSLLPTALQIVEQGTKEGLHLGAQIYVSQQGVPLVNCAIGESAPGSPLAPDTVMLWLSSIKPVAAVAIGQLLERGQLHLDDPVSQFIPEFGNQGKEAITIRHLLTHTGGFRTADYCDNGTSWEEIIDCVCSEALEPNWIPGQKAGYHLSGSWLLLGELVRRLDGRLFPRYVREEIFQPLQMADSWAGMPPEQYQRYGSRIGLMYTTEKALAELHPRWNGEAACVLCLPGSNGRGPICELGRFYEMLLGFQRTHLSKPILKPDTIALLTARHRIGQYDHTFKCVIDWGLGFIINSNRYGTETIPYGYGRYCSENTFGHSGSQSSTGFADPAYGLVVAWVFNGTPGVRRHQKRAREINSAIYKDLELA